MRGEAEGRGNSWRSQAERGTGMIRPRTLHPRTFRPRSIRPRTLFLQRFTVSAKKIARDKKNARLFRSILSYDPKVFVFFS